MDFVKSFTYMFDDRDWVKKLAIGGLLLLLVIIPPLGLFTALVVTGYGLRVLRNVAEKKGEPLPEWDSWGEDWTKGLMVVLAGLLYALPAIIVGGLGAGLSALTFSSETSEIMGVGALCLTGLSCLVILWGLVVAVFFPAALIKYALEGQFASFFQFGEIWNIIRRNAANYAVLILLIVLAKIIGGMGSIVCGVGVFFTAFWANLVTAHLLGQIRAQAVSQESFSSSEQ